MSLMNVSKRKHFRFLLRGALIRLIKSDLLVFLTNASFHRLGGRLTDLEFFARRLKTGQSPKRAVAEIIDQSASEILKMYLLTIDKSNLKWSTEQVRT